MSAPLWVLEMARAFWREAGGEEPFPRELRRPVARALPLSITYLPGLRVAGIDAWLAARSVDCSLSVPDRPLRACLLAHRGHGFIFIDGQDCAAEQRISLAHELAHYLRHYRQPREEAVRLLGPEALEVFDGERPARAEEFIHALLSRAPIGVFTHLLDREGDGRIGREPVARAEREADRLAWELLAPEEMLCAAGEDEETMIPRLIEEFGFPAPVAARYARELCPAPVPSFAARLGLAP